MKRQLLLTLAIVSGFTLGSAGIGYAQGDQDGHGWRRHGGRGGHGDHHGHGGMDGENPMEHLNKVLNLTPDQQAKVQPIVAQAKPQLQAIHQEAIEKTKAVMDTTLAQIRPLLTQQQQQKLDAMKQAHEKMREARQAMRAARQQ